MESRSLPDDFYETIRAKLYRRIGRSLGLAHRVLDLGCGRCELVTFLRTAYRQRVTGVDISDGKLPRHDAPEKSRAPMRCIQADAARLDFLAEALRERGRRLLVVDSDESNAGLFRMLGFDRPPAPLLELAGGKKKVQQTLRANLAAGGEEPGMSVLQ